MSHTDILKQLCTRLNAAELESERAFLRKLIAQLERKEAAPTLEEKQEEMHLCLAKRALALVGDVPDLVVVPYQAEGKGPRRFIASNHYLHGERCLVLTGDASFLAEHIDDWLEPTEETAIMQRDNSTCTRKLVEQVRCRKGQVRIVHADAFA